MNGRMQSKPRRTRGPKIFSGDPEQIAARREEDRRIIHLIEEAASWRDQSQKEALGWTENKRQGTDSGIGASFDPVRRYVFQEHNSFFRSRMPKSTHWSIVWSDLMMTMFIVFVVLFVFFSVNPKYLSSEEIGSEIGPAIGAGALGNGGGGGLGAEVAPVREAMERIFTTGRQTVLAENLGDFASVDVAPDKSVRIVLTGDLFFASGSAELKRDASLALAKVAGVLRESPLKINVVGHTDDLPIHSERYPSNWELSMARAGSVARFLIDEMGLPANRFYVTGYASNQPVRRNDSPENRAANRRVEIVVTKDLPDAMQPLEPEKIMRFAGRNSAI